MLAFLLMQAIVAVLLRCAPLVIVALLFIASTIAGPIDRE